MHLTALPLTFLCLSAANACTLTPAFQFCAAFEIIADNLEDIGFEIPHITTHNDYGFPDRFAEARSRCGVSGFADYGQ